MDLPPLLCGIFPVLFFECLIRTRAEDPMRQCTFEKESFLPQSNNNRRVGRPRKQWAVETYKKIWIDNHGGSGNYFTDNLEHCVQWIVDQAKERLFYGLGGVVVVIHVYYCHADRRQFASFDRLVEKMDACPNSKWLPKVMFLKMLSKIVSPNL